MKINLNSVLGTVCAIFICSGCSEQRAEKELVQLSAKEAAGGQAKALLDDYQAFAAKYPSTKAVSNAQQRIAALKIRLETEQKEAAADKDFAKLLEEQLATSQPKEIAQNLQAFISKHPGTKSAARAQERLTALKPKLEEQEKNESAEKEYAEILTAEQGGAEPKTLCNQYEAFIAKYADTTAATRARERLATLSAKVKESDQAKADQDKVQQAFEAERDRRLNQLRASMVEAAKQEGLKAHPAALKDSASAEKHGEEHFTTGSNGKSWRIQQEYLITVGAFLKSKVLVACTGQLRYNEFTKTFEGGVQPKILTQ